MNRSLGLLIAGGFVVVHAFAERATLAADPTTGACLAASESSLTLRRQHKLRDAQAQLLICSAASCPADVRDECLRRVAEVKAAIPTVVFEAKDAAGADVVAVKVTMDGQGIADRLDGTALPLDPGEHAFTFTAGSQPVEKSFVIREGEKGRRERITFAPTAVAGAPAQAPASLVSTPPASSPAGPTAGGRLGTQRILAIVAAGVGLAGVGVGIGYGLEARSKHDQARDACSTSTCSDRSGVNLWSDAVSAGNVSTAAFTIGIAGLAAGGVLWFAAKSTSARPAEPPPVEIGFGPRALRLSGRW